MTDHERGWGRLAVWIATFAEGVAGASLVALSLLTFISVLGRILHLPLGGADELAGYLLGILVFWGAPAAVHHGALVRLELSDRWLRRSPFAMAIELSMHAMALLYGILAVYATFRLASESLRFHALSSGLLALPLVVPQAVVAIGLILLLLYLVLRTVVLVGERRILERRDSGMEID